MENVETIEECFKSKNPKKQHGIIYRIKPDIHSKSHEYQKTRPNNKWDVHKWYKTSQDRDKALLILKNDKSIYEYKTNGI